MARFKDLASMFVLAFWAALAPIHTLLYSVLALVALDLVTGIWKSMWPKDPAQKAPVTSRRLRETVAKLGPYFVVLLVGLLVDKAAGTDAILSRVASLGLCGIEAKSIAENLKLITGLDLLGSLIEKLKPQPPRDTP